MSEERPFHYGGKYDDLAMWAQRIRQASDFLSMFAYEVDNMPMGDAAYLEGIGAICGMISDYADAIINELTADEWEIRRAIDDSTHKLKGVEVKKNG